MTWKMTIEFYGLSFEGMKSMARRAFSTIDTAQSVKGLSCISIDSFGYGYTVRVVCPIEERITQLRKEADDLEKTLL